MLVPREERAGAQGARASTPARSRRRSPQGQKLAALRVEVPGKDAGRLRPRRRRRRAARRPDDPDQRRGAADPRPRASATCPAGLSRSADMARGAAAFISFEGIDGSGKSTQLRAPRRAPARRRRQPSSRPASPAARPAPSRSAACWSRATPAAGRPRPRSCSSPPPAATTSSAPSARRSPRGATVLSDRFANSTRVYQGVARADLRAMVDALHALAIGVEPDLTLILDLDPGHRARPRPRPRRRRGPLRAPRRRLPGPAARGLPRARRRVPRPLPRRPRRRRPPSEVAARIAAAVARMTADAPTSPTASPGAPHPRETAVALRPGGGRGAPSSPPPPPAGCTTPGCSPARAASARRRSPGASPAT